MISILYIFVAIIALFVLLLILKSLTKLKFCVICISISITWIGLVVLYWMDLFNNPIFLGILIGQSIVGFYYFLEKRMPEKFHLFRLPFLLSLTLFGYSLIETPDKALSIISLLGIVWAILILMYYYRTKTSMRSVVDKLIACCKDW
jgi:hypothetical protein